MASWHDDSARKARVQRLGDDISEALGDIRALFRDDVKITLVVRVPSKPDGSRDTVLTDDDPRQAVKAIEALFSDPKSEVYPTGIARVPGEAKP